MRLDMETSQGDFRFEKIVCDCFNTGIHDVAEVDECGGLNERVQLSR